MKACSRFWRNWAWGWWPFSPMANGFLPGRYGKGQHFNPATDYRAAMPQFTDEAVDQNAALLKLLNDMAVEKHATPAQISLAWMLCKRPWIVPIPGTRKEDRMTENAGAARIKLSSDEVDALDRALDSMKMSAVFGELLFLSMRQKKIQISKGDEQNEQHEK